MGFRFPPFSPLPMDFSKHSKEELDERALADTAVALNE
jgi:hypothetical protein